MEFAELITLIVEKFFQFIDYFFTVYNKSGDYVYYFYFNYSRAILDFIHAFFESGFKALLFITMLLGLFYLFMSIFLIIKKKGKNNKDENFSNLSYTPSVTIQIPTFNELAAINCAKKCLKFDYPMDKVQILIGDDSSDKKISKEISSFASNHNNIGIIQRATNDGFKPGNLENMLKYSEGEYIIIFDSDFLPDKDFLKRIIAPFEDDTNLSVVQARWKPHNFNQNIISVLGGSISILFHYIALSFISRFKGNTFLCGSAEAIKKKDLVEVGGWKKGSLTEDIECSMRLIKNGKKLIYLEDLECKCEVPFTFKDLCKQQMRWAYGVISAMKEHLFSLVRGKSVKSKDKIAVLIFISGYMFSFLLLGITVFGIMSVVSNKPAPIDWARFLSETTVNIALTSGFLISSIVALFLSKRIRQLPRMVGASISIGLVVTYYVNVGILKAFFNRKMNWFMLNKNGNKVMPDG